MDALKSLMRHAAIALTAVLTAVATGQPLPAHQSGRGVQLAYIDTSVSPCDDFYQYANGAWLKIAQIPADRGSWGSGAELYERNLAILHEILDDAARDREAPEGSIKRKVGDYYRSGMDSAKVEAQGLEPLRDELKRIDGMRGLADLLKEMGRLHRMNVNPLFNFFVYMDFKDVTTNIAQFYQGGLGMPNCEYYTKTDEASQKLRDQYVEHVAAVFRLAGDADAAAKAHAQTVMAMETRLARASMTPVEERDPKAIYNKVTLAGLDTMAPGVMWKRYFAALRLPDADAVNVGQPRFFKEAAAMLNDVPLSDWRTYFRWNLLAAEASRLSSAFVNENFRFSGGIIRGIKEIEPRWKRMFQAVDAEMGEALGQLFVERTFSPEAKEHARQMVLNLKAALRDRISQLTWITDSTRAQAVTKLDATAIKIGYPDKWRDYSALHVDADSYVGNAMEADEFEFQRNLDKIGKPVDRTEWGMTPATVDAYYNANFNEIVFPAGILQPPFFDASADDATMYGGIGAIIGHELTHGFDDEGRQFDAAGNLKDWWTEQDAKNYAERAAVVKTQFNGYVAIDTMHINGALTLGENIADLGGVKIAYLAFQKSLEGKPHPTPIDGFTAEQRFFLAYAQAWKRITKPEGVKLMLANDPHSPPRFRVLGPLSNLPAFAQAFGCPPGSKMSLTTRAEIW